MCVDNMEDLLSEQFLISIYKENKLLALIIKNNFGDILAMNCGKYVLF